MTRDEVNDATLELVNDFLHYLADELENAQPTATRSVANLRAAASEIPVDEAELDEMLSL